MSITPPSLPVLRGRKNTSLRFDGSALLMSRADKELHIPLAAVAEVRGEGRSVEIRLTAPDGGRAAVHRIEDVSEAAAGAFTSVVEAALAEVERAVDGGALVTVRAPAAEDWAVRRRRLVRWGWLGLVLVLGVETLVVTLAGDPVASVAVWMCGLTSGLLAHAGVSLLPFGNYMWRLPRHGVTVVAQYGGYVDGMHVYDFTDLAGNRFAYTPPRYRGEQLEVVYDPDDPLKGSERELLLSRRAMLAPAVACGVLALLGLLLTLALIPLAILT